MPNYFLAVWMVYNLITIKVNLPFSFLDRSIRVSLLVVAIVTSSSFESAFLQVFHALRFLVSSE